VRQGDGAGAGGVKCPQRLPRDESRECVLLDRFVSTLHSRAMIIDRLIDRSIARLIDWSIDWFHSLLWWSKGCKIIGIVQHSGSMNQ
jgi:hypothetical protein